MYAKVFRHELSSVSVCSPFTIRSLFLLARCVRTRKREREREYFVCVCLCVCDQFSVILSIRLSVMEPVQLQQSGSGPLLREISRVFLFSKCHTARAELQSSEIPKEAGNCFSARISRSALSTCRQFPKQRTLNRRPRPKSS